MSKHADVVLTPQTKATLRQHARQKVRDNKLKVGLSFKTIKKVAKKVVVKPITMPIKATVAVAKKAPIAASVAKAAAPMVKKLAQAAKTVGPAVSMVYPPAGVAITAAGALVSRASSGVKEAQDKIKEIKKAGGLASDILKVAETASKTKAAQDLIALKNSGSASAAQKINEIKDAAARGIGEAVDSFKTLANAAAGMDFKPGDPIPTPVVATDKSKLSPAMLGGGALAAAGIAYLVIRRK